VGNRNRWWKVLGVASVVGVVATGALVARDERQRRAYTPDEVRDRLRERMESADAADDDGGPDA
jgi:cytochrome c-type biogenesis protein CcmE